MAERNDPYRSTRFKLEIDGIIQAGFSECTLPDSTTEPIEYREGDDPPTPSKLWNITKYGNLTLKWGTTDSMELFEWRKAVEQGKLADARRNVAVIVQDEEGKPGARWEFAEAWPSKYDAPDLNATGTEVSIETLEITHESMERMA